MKVLVTGGCGYIGSHTIVDLVEAGYEVVCVDNNVRSDCSIHSKIYDITGVHVQHYITDVTNLDDLRQVFRENPDISAILHFAAHKSVGQSVLNPLAYYRNNILGVVNVLQCMTEFDVSYFVFSSSCTVYGNTTSIPVTEAHGMGIATSPYGASKQMCERIIQDYFRTHTAKRNACILRYFNPAGAHPSLLIGESARFGVPSLTTAIVLAAKERRPVKVFGSDYATRDGTCVRDFIHVCDVAAAHTKALNYLIQHHDVNVSIFNLAASKPRTVLETIRTFERVHSISLDIEFCARRPGDVEAICADCTFARKELDWEPKYGLEEIVKSAYEYEVRTSKNE